MATNRLHPSSGARRRTAVVVACIPALIAIDTEVRTPSMVSETETRYDVETPADEYHEGEEELEGRVSPQHDSRRPTVTAAFQRESYRPGSLARLTIAGPATRVSIQLFRAGPERTEPRANDVMTGAPVTPRIPVGAVVGGRVVRIPVRRWQSGLYFARLTAHGKRVGHAPFILRPARLGEHRIAVVLPTFTWQAYNRRDTNGEGRGETRYADWQRKTACSSGPTCTAASRRTTVATTSGSCAGSHTQAVRSITSATPTSTPSGAATTSPARTRCSSSPATTSM